MIDITFLIMVVVGSVIFGFAIGGLSFIIKMKLSDLKTRKQLKEDKGLFYNITDNKHKNNIEDGK